MHVTLAYVIKKNQHREQEQTHHTLKWESRFSKTQKFGDMLLCMQELFFGGGWITLNIVSDVYILTKGKKSINAVKNENVELTHTQVVCGRLCVLWE